MAKFEHTTVGDIDDFIRHFESAIVRTSATAKPEDASDFEIGGARMLVRVYERFSVAGSSRVSLQIGVLAVGEQIAISAITSGGSRAMLFKVNTLGETTFLERARDAIMSWSADPY